MTKWSDIRVMKFLEIYEKHECLWNPRVESYKNKISRDVAFESIIQELNMPRLTPNDIKLKIKSIRTTYKRELTSVLKSRKDGEAESSFYVPKLFWFKRADAFLREVSLARRSSSTRMEYKQEVAKHEITKNMFITIPHLPQPYKPESTEECVNTRNDQNEESEQEIICNEFNEEDITVEPTTTNAYKMDIAENTPALCQQQQQQQQINCCRSPEDDEYIIFCRSVAAQIRAIPDSYSRSVAKFKIQQILFEAETGHYRKSAYITVPAAQEINNL